MLENKKFIAWANENIIVVVGHTQTDHPTEIEDDKGKKTPGCPLYKGLTCEEHRALPGECRSPPEGMPKLESTNLMPNSWVVTPDGTVTQVESAVQQVPGKIEELITDLQKEAGKHLTWKKYTKYRETFEATDAALAEGKLKDALKALAKAEKDTKKLPEGMKAEVDQRVEALQKAATEKFEALQAGSEDLTVKIKAANKLKTEVGKRLKRGYLPVVATLKDWIKRAKDGTLADTPESDAK